MATKAAWIRTLAAMVGTVQGSVQYRYGSTVKAIREADIVSKTPVGEDQSAAAAELLLAPRGIFFSEIARR